MVKLLSKFAIPEMRLAVLVLVAFNAACTSSVVVPPMDQGKLVAAQSPEALCGRVAEIKSMPFKDERVADAAYNALVDAGEAVLPCLIDKVADATPMRDPRGIPGPTDTRVGDVAFFVLIDVAKLDFESMMPPEVKRVFKEEGVYAYHRFVGEEANRRRFQSSLREWYRRKSGELPQHKNAL